MPPSQLKQLKASLRESGILGPQQSKKQKRQQAQAGGTAKSTEKRIQRNAALSAIRERFNPFEVKAPAQRLKYDVTTRDAKASGAPGRVRPGVTKSLGEEKRRQTLLKEIHERNKVGGIVDRRFGENDPTMTPEERAAERFARESQRKLKKESMFNLEDDEEEEIQLTHAGQSLSFSRSAVGQDDDDFRENDLDEDGDFDGDESSRKRKRNLDEADASDLLSEGSGGEIDQPGRKKSKNEVMKELIAKSKFHKYERQKMKEDDEDLREELDKELPDLFAALRGAAPQPKKRTEPGQDDLAAMNPDRAAALMGGTLENDTDREYDQRLKQLTFDKRSQPTDRTKTEEEKAEEEAQRLKALEQDRLRRMRGDELSEEDDDRDQDAAKDNNDDDGPAGDSDDESMPDDAKQFGLQQTNARPDLGVEDEDDFIIDDDLIETGSDVGGDWSEDDLETGEDDGAGDGDEAEAEDQVEDELINGFTLPNDDGQAATGQAATVQAAEDGPVSLAFTFPCPTSHEQFLETTREVSFQDLPTVVQRIRALHHARLHPDNKAKLAQFAAILVQHVAHLANLPTHEVSFSVLESLLRHVHSMAKSHADSVAQAFRAHLRQVSAKRPLKLLPGDFIVLTGIAMIFPTSDHFHAVATPAHLCIARFLGQGPVDSLADLVSGAYAATLCLQYQAVSKRYMPEFMNFVLNALCNLSPEEPKTTSSLGLFPARKPQPADRHRIRCSSSAAQHGSGYRKIEFGDMRMRGHDSSSPQLELELELSLVATLVSLIDLSAGLIWTDKSAFHEIFEPAARVLQHLSRSCAGRVPGAVQNLLLKTLDRLRAQLLPRARRARRPLALHNHRPLAIKTAIPKFEDNFHPDKHYDPNRERAEVNRLKAELKREHKGAMRELRKDGSFIAREKLLEKKQRDAEYEQKYKRLVAEIQNEEGREANMYEREKKMRQGKR